MSKKMSTQVVQKIQQEKIQPRAKWLFWLSGALMVVGAVALMIVASFLINLVIFKVRTYVEVHCGCWEARMWAQIWQEVPWLALGVAVLGLIGGGFLFKKVDGVYKWPKWLWVSLGVILVIFLAILIDKSGFNEQISCGGNCGGCKQMKETGKCSVL